MDAKSWAATAFLLNVANLAVSFMLWGRYMQVQPTDEVRKDSAVTFALVAAVNAGGWAISYYLRRPQ